MKKLFLFYLVLFPTWIFAQNEKIERFHAEIRVNTAGFIEVTESITYTTAVNGKRGIVRSLPLRRKMSNGQTIRSKIDLQSVKNKGEESPYHTEKRGDFLSIYVGEESTYLDPGSYQYELTYRVADQIEAFEGYDELFWNVNGTAWSFPMAEVSAVIHLPSDADILQYACYTGSLGSREQNCMTEKVSHGMQFSAANLGPGENLSIAVGFTQGVVAPAPPPNFFQKYGFQLLGFGLGLILLIYYVFTWKRYGIDPAKPTVVPQFDPPAGLSPASVALIASGSYSKNMITPALVSLAAKGYLKINDESTSYVFGIFKSQKYVLTKLKEADQSLPEEEKILHQFVFREDPEVSLNGKYDSRFAAAVQKYQKSLKSQWNSLIFEGFNAKFWVLPILLLIVYFILNVTLIDYFVYEGRTGWFILFLGVNVLIFLFYQWLIRKPSKKKLQLRADIEGFKMYLSAAEERMLQNFNPPEITPERFEKLLPYAIALDVEEIWGEKFSQKLAQSSTMPSSRGYQPAWYNGPISNVGRFGHALNSSLSNTLTASSMKPSSSGGSGGGGFSGGGGGGGGGGSW
ncbi:DUF2207 domain-containing protein [Algoriphagus sp.]|uniref:DUF2207 domain-containing protein n=1 Tax=Algoriphagus sp. TaxID=1872435 RepID=UPI00260AA4E5|nr:DUF2207 domain-containing protein [Algoriphagus sp.]